MWYVFLGIIIAHEVTDTQHAHQKHDMEVMNLVPNGHTLLTIPWGNPLTIGR